MGDRPGTRTESTDGGTAAGAGEVEPVPGLLLAFSLGRSCCVPLPLRQGRLEIGRGDGPPSPFPSDPRISRRHAAVTFDGERYRVEDLGSHNGTFLDGVRVKGSLLSAAARVLRAGDSLFLLSPDVRALQVGGIQTQEDAPRRDNAARSSDYSAAREPSPSPHAPYT